MTKLSMNTKQLFAENVALASPLQTHCRSPTTPVFSPAKRLKIYCFKPRTFSSIRPNFGASNPAKISTPGDVTKSWTVSANRGSVKYLWASTLMPERFGGFNPQNSKPLKISNMLLDRLAQMLVGQSEFGGNIPRIYKEFRAAVMDWKEEIHNSSKLMKLGVDESLNLCTTSKSTHRQQRERTPK